ncbi:hypothetical protein EBT31_22400 [bacterium]|jgi:hypothetical protein|nr:hypothetical protein [bacterium]
MPAMDDSSTQHLYWPGCQMHFIINTRATKSGVWLPLVDMEVGDYIEVVDEDELRIARQVINNWHRSHASKFTIRTDRSNPSVRILRRVR